jgi:hypothetical protein
MRERITYSIFIVFAILIFPHIINAQNLPGKMYLSSDGRMLKRGGLQNSGLCDFSLQLADPVSGTQNAYTDVSDEMNSFVIQTQKFAIFNTRIVVNEMQMNTKLQIFPNPANGYINIGILNYKENTELNIYDFSERGIIHSAIPENEKRVDVSSFNPGVCFTRIGILAKKLIVV